MAKWATFPIFRIISWVILADWKNLEARGAYEEEKGAEVPEGQQARVGAEVPEGQEARVGADASEGIE